MTSIASRQPVPDDWQPLYEAASAARSQAYAPYSHFAVGAALRSCSGVIYSGCNVENASSGLTVCAERVALWKAISSGEQYFTHLAIVTENGSPPCGACRQVLAEFAPNLAVLIADTQGNARLTDLGQLFPDPFKLAR